MGKSKTLSKKAKKPNVRSPILSQAKFSRSVFGLIALALGVLGYLLVKLIFAASTASLSLSPSSQTIARNTSFSVAVRVDSGTEPINTVQANLSYPDDKLEFVSISAAGSAFKLTAPSPDNTGGGGSVRIARGTFDAETGAVTPVSGNQLVATVNFKTRSTVSSAVVSFSSSSGVYRSSDSANILTVKNNGTYTIVTGATPVNPPPPPSTPPPPPPAPSPPPPSASPPPSPAPEFDPEFGSGARSGSGSTYTEELPASEFSQPSLVPESSSNDEDVEVLNDLNPFGGEQNNQNPGANVAGARNIGKTVILAVILLLLGSAGFGGLWLLRKKSIFTHNTALPEQVVVYPSGPTNRPSSSQPVVYPSGPTNRPSSSQPVVQPAPRGLSLMPSPPRPSTVYSPKVTTPIKPAGPITNSDADDNQRSIDQLPPLP